MPLNIPDHLPSIKILEEENIFLMKESIANSQDIRPLRIAILNIMPTKIITETQLLRLLSNTPLQIEIDLLHTSTHTSRNTPEKHLNSFYKTFENVSQKKYDGMIITGAPVEHLKFEKVAYWNEISQIFNWAETQVTSTLFICWAAQAALYHYYGIQKYNTKNKIFGVFDHNVINRKYPIVRGFDDVFQVPHSRNSDVTKKDILNEKKLEILAESSESGVFLITSTDNRKLFATGHLEYDAETLNNEYLRDFKHNAIVELPKNYFPNNNYQAKPIVRWRSHANLLFSNWLNYYVYQQTPYKLDDAKIKSQYLN